MLYSNKLSYKVMSELGFFFLEIGPRNGLGKNLFETKSNFKIEETDFWQTFWAGYEIRASMACLIVL